MYTINVLEILLLIGTGFLAGFLNVLAGGGSLITLPVLIFLGVPSSMANATNRLGLFFQNVFSVSGFRSKGVGVFPYSYWAGLAASAGAMIGALIAVEIADEVFNRILAIVMILVMVATVAKPAFLAQGAIGSFSFRRNAISISLFFFVGIYGGFIHAGIGFLKIALLSLIHALPMAKVNSIKVFVALCYTSVAMVVFIANDLILWKYGFALAIGTSLGGWIASRWSVSVADKYIRIFLLITVSILAFKLWFF